jgi:hypothetical protein
MAYRHQDNILCLLLAIISIWLSSCADAREEKQSLDEINDEYDFIVVGGGTSGLVMANRLSLNPNSKTSHWLIYPLDLVSTQN